MKKVHHTVKTYRSVPRTDLVRRWEHREPPYRWPLMLRPQHAQHQARRLSLASSTRALPGKKSRCASGFEFVL